MRLLCSLLVAHGVWGGFCDPSSDWLEVFSDEFDTLNDTTWTVRNNTVEEDSSCREAMCLTDNVSIRDSALVLTAKREARGWAQYTTGAVQSQGKRAFAATAGHPVRICVSGKLPGTLSTGAGYWPAFWLMPGVFMSGSDGWWVVTANVFWGCMGFSAHTPINNIYECHCRQ